VTTKRPAPEEKSTRQTEAESLVPAALAGEASGKPITSGYPSLDSLLGGGLRRGDLIVLTGDVGAGKSALTLAMTMRSTAAGQSAVYMTGEMSTARVMERALAIEGRVRVDDLRRGGLDDVAHSGVAAAAIGLRRSPPFIEDLHGGLDGVSDFLAQNLGIELTIIDPIQALLRGDTSVDEELAGIARRLKELALRRNTVILAVSGLRDSVAGRTDLRPTLRGSRRTWCDASPRRRCSRAVSGELYAPSAHVEGATELAVLKNRSGPTGLVDLFFYKQWMRFEDMVEPK
jgi:replicative DNA helicase